MDHFAGLDVSVKETSICIVDDTGRIVREVKVASEPEALLKVLGNPIYRFQRIGLEAGPLSQWLFSALAEAELPVVCVETRHMQAVLKAQINKTDRNDARGIAQMIRVGLYRPVHVKTLTQSETADAADPSQAAAVEGDCHRERSTWYFTQLRPQGRNGRNGEVRGPHQGACRELLRLGCTGGTAAHRAAGATRTDRHARCVGDAGIGAASTHWGAHKERELNSSAAVGTVAEVPTKHGISEQLAT
jgi:hypothetical protein